ncbi:hypothetical protein ACFVHQ_01400 [Actinomycetes bacterium NPDC127524]
MDNTIRGVTGGLGSYATDFVDLLLESSGAVDKVEKPAKDLSQKPLARAFLLNNASTGKSIDKLYNLKDKLPAQKALQVFGGSVNEEEYKLVNSGAKQVGGISKQIRAIENSPTLDGETKRKQIDVLNKQRNQKAFDLLKNKGK